MQHKTWGQWVTALQGLDNKSCLIITTWHRCFRDFSGFSKLWLRMFGEMEDRIRTLTTLHSISHTERRVLSRGLLEVIHLKARHCKHCDYIHSLTFTSKERHASYWETVMIRRSVTYGHVNAYTHTLVPNHHGLPVHPIASCQLTSTQRRQLEGKLEDNVPESLSLELEQFNWDWISGTSPLLRDGQQIRAESQCSTNSTRQSAAERRENTLFVGGSVHV